VDGNDSVIAAMRLGASGMGKVAILPLVSRLTRKMARLGIFDVSEDFYMAAYTPHRAIGEPG
jgi:hypothetical protein